MTTVIGTPQSSDETRPAAAASGWDRSDASEWAVKSGPILRFLDRLAARRAARR